jgi:hypothetical protein
LIHYRIKSHRSKNDFEDEIAEIIDTFIALK